MDFKQKFCLATTATLLTGAIGCTIINRPKTLQKTEVQDTLQTKKLDIFEQYEQAKANSIKGTISADSFQTIRKRFEEKMKYVECGD